MARTAEGERLTEAHRLAQLQIRAQAIRDYMRLWPVWQEDDEDSLLAMLAAAYVLVKGYHALSSTLGASYYRSYRRAERVPGTPEPRRGRELYEGEIVGTLRLVGDDALRRAERAGQSPEKARQTALIRTSGEVTRLTLAGGRDTVEASVKADEQAVGWARVTDSDPCAFCLALSSRGAVYKEDTVGFKAHGHCGCSNAPVFSGDPLRESERHRETYNAAIREAKASGDFKRGTDSDQINAVRRYLAQQHTSSAQ